ncbi:hypothetical protein [Aurantimonas sp. VKM B-3413]|uniref:hypothetical protein n=1 Tax=Aurantimonas sp. VKM B-3413 TaxID=2779401 RepID=UPI001E3DF7EB|nr:hypothetical protein [Aurantimonas sp. VKM B-3413]MCB8840580.1 hypothetical protein [Aurantimonas sp. VKM B-3413]
MLRQLVVALPLVCMTSAALAQDLTFNLINNTSSAVTEFYTSPVSTDDWEENMVSDPIAPGEQASANIADGRAVCEYDIKAVFADGDTVTDNNINLCELGSYTLHE